MRISSGGLVGIGTAPSTDLHLYSSAPTFRLQDGGNWGSNASGLIQFYDQNSLMAETGVETGGDFNIQLVEAGNIKLYTSNSERMRITSGGLVGIGSTTPSHRLQIYDATSDAPLMIQSGDGYVGIKFKDPDDDDNLFYRGDIASFYFTGARLGINDSSPDYALSVNSSDTQFKLKNYG